MINNLVYTLDREISARHFNNDEIVRYIYLRLCEIFSFDTRYYYASFFKDYEMYKKIVNKHINVKHVDTNLVVCHSIVNPLKTLIEMFTSKNVDIYNSISHSYAYVDFLGYKYKLDLTGMNDLAYVKMGLETKGFQIEGYNNPNFEDFDRSLGFELVSDSSYISKLNINPNLSLFEKSMKISELLDKSRCKFEFSDAKAMVSRLEQMLKIDIKKIDFDTFLDKDYNFHRLSKVEGRYFDLSKIGYQCKMYEIDENKYLTLKSSLMRRKVS